MIDLTALMGRIIDLGGKVDAAPALRWGTVVQSSPLRITLDGSIAMLPLTPDTLVPVLVPGERVRVELQANRVTILGAAGRPRGIPQGTNAQMLLTAAPDGARFFNTTGNAEYLRVGGQWRGGIGTITPSTGTTIRGLYFERKGTEVELTVRFDRAANIAGGQVLGQIDQADLFPSLVWSAAGSVALNTATSSSLRIGTDGALSYLGTTSAASFWVSCKYPA